MAQDPVKLVADKKLTADILKSESFEDLRSLLHASVENSPALGITRDAQTGQFVRRDPLTPAAQVAEPEERVFSKTVKIGGKDFTFTDESEEGLTNQIASAQTVAENLQEDRSSVTPRSVRKAESDAALEAVRQAELSLAFKRGEISTADYLRESGALAQALRDSGVDVEKISEEQYTESWEKATKRFLYSPAGADWPGGEKNLELIGLQLASMGLTTEPSVESLAKAWAEMKAKGTVFPNTSDERVLEELEGLNPQEILERFKAAHSGDPEAANQGFIDSFRGGRIGGSSGIFGR